MNRSETSSIQNFTINGETITSSAQLEQILDKVHLPCPSLHPCEKTEDSSEAKQFSPLCEDWDYTRLTIKFIEQIGQQINGLDYSTPNFTDTGHLICAAGNSALAIQYFPEGAALIAWMDTYYGLIYFYINYYENWCAAKQIDSDHKQNEQHTAICPEKELFCQNKETLQDILLYFYETSERCPKYQWIEDFSYTGSGGWHRDWMKKSLKRLTIPEEQNETLKKLRKSQESGEWQWGTPWKRADYWRGAVCWENPDEMAYLEQLTHLALSDSPDADDTLDADSSNDSNATVSDSSVLREHEILMRQTAARLIKDKEFARRASGIRNLCFLRNCGHLRGLDLRCNDVEDLSPLAALHQLKELTLDYNLISDLSPLEGLEQLRHLWLMGNKVRSLEPLRGLHNLNELHLRGNPLETGTLAYLRKCKRLGVLDLSYTGIRDISDLEYCRAWALHLYGNPGLTGLEVITTMKKLSCIDLDWETARRYDIPALVPRFTEYARYGDHVKYVWPQKYFDD